MNIKVYISGALLSAKNLTEARAQYEELARRLEAIGIQPYLPHQKTDPIKSAHLEAEDVFDKDVAALRACNIVVAFLDEPSLGVGAEVAIADAQKIPVLGAYRQGNTISRFIVGFIKRNANNRLIPYTTLDDIVLAVSEMCDISSHTMSAVA